MRNVIVQKVVMERIIIGEVPVDNSAKLAKINKDVEESEKEDKVKKEKNQEELDRYNEELNKLIKEKSGYERIKKIMKKK